MMALGRIIAAIALSAAVARAAVGQQAVEARRFIVASAHRDATTAGIEVLRRGGNVVDAAVAVSLCLGVAEPYGSGLGGTLVMLYRDAATRQVYCVEACSKAPAGLDGKKFAALPMSKRRSGYTSVAVPGLPAGLWAAHSRWGSHPWAELVAPAAELARNGVVLSEPMRRLFAPDVVRLRHDPESARLFLVDRQAPPTGARLKNLELAGTLERLAADGAREFYEGETAHRLVAAAAANGSALTLADLREYEPEVVKPLSASYRGNIIYTSPPPQIGGLTVLAALKALDRQQWNEAAPRDADYIDSIGRVLLGVYPEVEREAADVPTAGRAARRLLSGASIARILAKAAGRELGGSQAVVGGDELTADDTADASTSHFIVADNAGNMVSLTQSLSFHFGAGVVAPGTGVLLNNTLSNFTVTKPRAANFAGPGKRPRSTVAPIIVTRGGAPMLAMGVPGGQRIPTTSIQLIVDVLDFGRPLAEAFQQPRFHVRRPIHPGDPANIVDVEGLPSPATRRELLDRGWRLVVHRADGHYFGGGNAVEYRSGGTLLGVADLRRSNLAVGD